MDYVPEDSLPANQEACCRKTEKVILRNWGNSV